MASRTVEKEIQSLESALKEHPDSLLFARLADAFRKEGNIPQAIELCTNGLKRFPDYTTGRILLGRCYLEQQQTDKAADEFMEVCTADRKNHVAIKMLADIYVQQGRNDAAGDLYTILALMDPDNSSLQHLSTQYPSTGNTDLYSIIGSGARPQSSPDGSTPVSTPMENDFQEFPDNELQSFDAALEDMAVTTQTDIPFSSQDLPENISDFMNEESAISGSDVSERMATLFGEPGAPTTSDSQENTDIYQDIHQGSDTLGDIDSVIADITTSDSDLSGDDVSDRIEELFSESAPKAEELQISEPGSLIPDEIDAMENPELSLSGQDFDLSDIAEEESSSSLPETPDFADALQNIENEEELAIDTLALSEDMPDNSSSAISPDFDSAVALPAENDEQLSGDDFADRLESLFSDPAEPSFTATQEERGFSGIEEDSVFGTTARENTSEQLGFPSDTAPSLEKPDISGDDFSSHLEQLFPDEQEPSADTPAEERFAAPSSSDSSDLESLDLINLQDATSDIIPFESTDDDLLPFEEQTVVFNKTPDIADEISMLSTGDAESISGDDVADQFDALFPDSLPLSSQNSDTEPKEPTSDFSELTTLDETISPATPSLSDSLTIEAADSGDQFGSLFGEDDEMQSSEAAPELSSIDSATFDFDFSDDTASPQPENSIPPISSDDIGTTIDTLFQTGEPLQQSGTSPDAAEDTSADRIDTTFDLPEFGTETTLEEDSSFSISTEDLQDQFDTLFPKEENEPSLSAPQSFGEDATAANDDGEPTGADIIDRINDIFESPAKLHPESQQPAVQSEDENHDDLFFTPPIVKNQSASIPEDTGTEQPIDEDDLLFAPATRDDIPRDEDEDTSEPADDDRLLFSGRRDGSETTFDQPLPLESEGGLFSSLSSMSEMPSFSSNEAEPENTEDESFMPPAFEETLQFDSALFEKMLNPEDEESPSMELSDSDPVTDETITGYDHPETSVELPATGEDIDVIEFSDAELSEPLSFDEDAPTIDNSSFIPPPSEEKIRQAQDELILDNTATFEVQELFPQDDLSLVEDAEQEEPEDDNLDLTDLITDDSSFLDRSTFSNTILSDNTEIIDIGPSGEDVVDKLDSLFPEEQKLPPQKTTAGRSSDPVIDLTKEYLLDDLAEIEPASEYPEEENDASLIETMQFSNDLLSSDNDELQLPPTAETESYEPDLEEDASDDLSESPISGKDIEDRLDSFFPSDDLMSLSAKSGTPEPDEEDTAEEQTVSDFYTLSGENAVGSFEEEIPDTLDQVEFIDENEDISPEAPTVLITKTPPQPAPLVEPTEAAPAGEDLFDEFPAETIEMSREEVEEAQASIPDERDAPFDIPDHVLTPTLADIYYQQGQYRLALQVFSRLLKQDPDNPKLLQRHAEIQEMVTLQENTPLSDKKPVAKPAQQPKKPVQKPKTPAATGNDSRPLAGVRIKKKVKDARKKNESK